MPLSPLPLNGGRRTRKSKKGVSVKTLKRTLKKAGLKVSGKKAALVKRAKKAHLIRGGGGPGEAEIVDDV